MEPVQLSFSHSNGGKLLGGKQELLREGNKKQQPHTKPRNAVRVGRCSGAWLQCSPVPVEPLPSQPQWGGDLGSQENVCWCDWRFPGLAQKRCVPLGALERFKGDQAQ